MFSRIRKDLGAFLKDSTYIRVCGFYSGSIFSDWFGIPVSSGLVGWLLKGGGLLKGSRLGIIDDRMRKPAPGRKHDFCSKRNYGGIVLLAV